MASEEEKKKYWCDQIKTMLGPCMITFAIPMMVPGFTITFVAFAEEDSFPKYGALHVVGILILGISIILIMLGCFLRFYWKPFIGPDIEMHLSPNTSFRNMHTGRANSRNLKLEKPLKEPNTIVNTTRRSSLRDSERARMDNIPSVSERKIQKSESETEGTGSESDLKKSLTGKPDRKFDIMASPRSRNLVPVNSDSHDETDKNCFSQNNFPEAESLEALKQFRKKKKRAKKRMQKTECEKEDYENNQASHLETHESGKEQKKATEVRKIKRKKKKKKALNALRTEQTGRGEDNFLSSLSEPKVSNLDVFDKRNDNEDSDHSVVSVGSADSVLAQYTSRSSKNLTEEIHENMAQDSNRNRLDIL